VSDELSGRTFRLKCKACGEAILVRGKGQGDGLGDEPIGPSPSISVLHAVEPAAIPPPPAPRPPPPTQPDVNPFVAQPITVARVAAAVDGSLAAASAEVAAPLPVPPSPAAPVEPLHASASGSSDPVDDLRRSLDEELGADAAVEIEEFQPGEPGARPIGRLREPGARAVMGLAGRRPSDGEGAMALATFTEPAVAGARPVRGPEREDVAGQPVPEPIQEFEAPSPPEAPRPGRAPLLVGLGLALAVGLAAGLLVARRGGEPAVGQAPAAAPVPAAAPAAVAPAAAQPAAPAVDVAETRPPPAAPSQARPAEAAADPRSAESADRAAPRKGARARRPEAAPPPPAGAEGVAPRGGLLDDDAPRAPAAGERERPAVPGAAEPAAEPAREPVPDAPRYVGSGFRSPRLAQADCLSENLRLPPNVAAMVAGPITVKFAVHPDGRVDQLQVMNKLPDPRIGEAVARAVRACEWVPGADADGTPTPLWVVQPMRFAP
jgi:TonB family protein